MAETLKSYEKPTVTSLGSVYDLTLGICVGGNTDPGRGITGRMPSGVGSLATCRG